MEMRTRPEINDLDAEEQQERFQKMRTAMLDALEGTQWLMGARNYIMRWRNMNELVTFVSSMLQISNEEKYAILAEVNLHFPIEIGHYEHKMESLQFPCDSMTMNHYLNLVIFD